MEFLVNDLSLHAQFRDLASFRRAVTRVMAIREVARRFGRALHCHRQLLQASVTPTMTMPQALQGLTYNERRALLQWLTQQGPFWEDARKHAPDDWLEWDGHIVTDTSLGEAGWCCGSGIERNLVSFIPSDWQFTPIPIDWLSETDPPERIQVSNYWDPEAVEAFLQDAPTPLNSWGQLEELATARFPEITFAQDAFAPLRGHPFVPAAAQRLVFVLHILNRFRGCFDKEGRRTAEGHEIYQNFFTGKKGGGGRGALFSDSSENEKQRFHTEMTFKNPTNSGKTIFCSWHGKIQTPPLRVHFSYPVRGNEELFVVYIGPKITKR
jgi:hypothetical protein